MPIQGLIDKLDTFEVVRDQIAAILATETASQQALATAASRDPLEWTLRVYSERSNPWSEFLNAPDADSVDATPIVNVTYDNVSFAKGEGSTVDRQRGEMTFHIDCYGYGVARDVEDGGHVLGDKDAADVVHRTVRLVRNILMASEYTYLALPRGVVSRRWVQGISMFQPALDGQSIQQIVAARLVFEVLANEFSPQYEGVPLDLVSTQVRRGPDGLVVYCGADFDTTVPDDS